MADNLDLTLAPVEQPPQPAADDVPRQTVDSVRQTVAGAGSIHRSRRVAASRSTSMILARRRCAAVTKDGRPCPASPLRRTDSDGKYRCFQHTDTVSDKDREISRKKGGLESARVRYLPLATTPMPVLSDPEGVRTLLAETIQQVRTGQLAPNAAQAVTAAVNSNIKLAELAIAVQLKDLERRLEERER